MSWPAERATSAATAVKPACRSFYFVNQEQGLYQSCSTVRAVMRTRLSHFGDCVDINLSDCGWANRSRR